MFINLNDSPPFVPQPYGKSTHYANKLHGTLDVYFAPIGGEKVVQYRAMLHRVKIYHKRGDSDTETILGFELDETKGEGLWEKYAKRVDTLYVITHCVKLSKPFPMTLLVKVSDDRPISEKYGYSYCLVYTQLGDPVEDLEIFPEEIQEPKKYFEGASKKISVNTYERSKVARMRCVQHHGVDCLVCGFNFENTYGEIGAGFIHVHHLKSLVEIEEEYEVDPIKDLIPICPNCHAMLHKKIPAYSIKKLQSIIRPSKKGLRSGLDSGRV